MWTQIIKTRIKPGKEAELEALMNEFKSHERPDSGLIRSTTARDQNDPDTLYMIVTFESEEKARLREQDPARQEGLTNARQIMADIFEGPPEFVDLNVVAEHTGA
jgi:quinol monooxygenase YgiN